ncbi:hypothetical protein ACKVMT_03860 [Halobacteriales archaeon Cl-PHB]
MIDWKAYYLFDRAESWAVALGVSLVAFLSVSSGRSAPMPRGMSGDAQAAYQAGSGVGELLAVVFIAVVVAALYDYVSRSLAGS